MNFQACENLNLLKRINVVVKEYTLKSILEEYLHLFEGLKKFDGTYHIEVDKSVPPVVNSKRNVPYTILPKLKQKFEELVNKGIMRLGKFPCYR